MNTYTSNSKNTFLKALFAIVFLWSFLPNIDAQKNRVRPYELDLQPNGLIYQRNHQKPFTGTAYDVYAADKSLNSKQKKTVPKEEIPFKDGRIHGKVQGWDRYGTKTLQAIYKNGKKEGIETQWYSTGSKKSEIMFVGDKPNGIYKEWYEKKRKNQPIQLMSTGEYVNGLENGVHTWWFRDGKKDQEVPYRMGKADGVVKNWFKNGQLKSTKEYRSGEQEGKTLEWFDTGVKMAERFYKGDKKSGTHSQWNKRGILEQEEDYESGVLKEQRNYRSVVLDAPFGYTVVFNEMNDFITLEARGKSVFQFNLSAILFAIDDNLVEVNKVELKELGEFSSDLDDVAILKAHKDYEFMLRGWNELYKDTKVEMTPFKTKNGQEALHWHFKDETMKERNVALQGATALREHIKGTNNRTKNKADGIMLKEQHFISILCGEHVVLLSSVVTEKNDVKSVVATLKNTANTLKMNAKRVEINALSDKLFGRK